MSHGSRLGYLLLLGAAVGCTSLPTDYDKRGVTFVDAGDRPIRSLEAGSSLHVAARGLEPGRIYEFRLGIDDRDVSVEEAVSFARAGTDAHGDISSFILWYHSGVIGCSPRVKAGQKLPRFMYRRFQDAEQDLRGRELTVTLHEIQPDESGRINPMKLEVSAPIDRRNIRLASRRSPMVYPSDADGCLVNSNEAQARNMYVSGRNFSPSEAVAISIVPNQRRCHVGDRINDLTGVGGAGAPQRIEADGVGRFTVRVWDAALQRDGVYDIVAQRTRDIQDLLGRVRATDIVSYAADTAYILFLRYPVGGPTMDLAGRPISGSPYFQFADSFADTGDTVWGAVDPTYVPIGHPGGAYAAYYVVNHRDVDGWDPAAGGSIDLVDVSGGIEIHRVKAGCINSTDTPIWYSPLPIGEYDVVVDFGINPAEIQTAYTTDAQYDQLVDFLDGADQIGFLVAKDPYALGPFSIGEAEYSDDDYFSTLLNANNVDLRAVVRYPATSAGVDTAVAPGQHPIFFIEHGNHKICEDSGHSQRPWDACFVRTVNHKGYMRLLEILASHGIIAVSIDAYDLTGVVPQWIAERTKHAARGR